MIDRDKFREMFQEEASDLLGELESSLLKLNENSDDLELVGRAFRALHTIKGSGSMFGFDEVAAFTHHIENAFDEVRKGRLEASADLISLTLNAADQIKSMLDEAAGRGTADPTVSAKILTALRELTGALESTEPQAKVGSQPKISAREVGLDPDGIDGTVSAPMKEWVISFRPTPNYMFCGSDPLLLLDSLARLGSLQIKADLSALPDLDDMNPEYCYVSWEMVLTTAASLDEVRDEFIFVEDSCELTVEAAASLLEEVSEQLAEVETLQAAAPASRGANPRTRASDRQPQAASIRVPAAKLDALVGVVGQLVTVQARLVEIAARSDDRDLQAVAEEVEALVGELRGNAMSMRTTPLHSTFERFKRLVFDLGRSLNKEVELTFEGGDTELDKSVIDQLNDPLMHLIRNSMDHGIEAPEARSAMEKPPVATIRLSAHHAGAQVLICVADDGKGIDSEAVREQAVAKGLIAADARLSESEIYSLIMEPGFSTARAITDVSGRGVGMDVVKRNVEALRGSIEIASVPGRGSAVTLRLPLTLAIIDGLLVRVGDARFVMPLANTVECVELTQQDIDQANGNHLANVRGEIIAYIRLREFLNMPAARPEREHLMVTETQHGRFGIVVDQVLGDHQTVIKNLGQLYRNVQVLSGATILGDGSVALILDLHRLIQIAIRGPSGGVCLPAPVPHLMAAA